jgi:hypothetical protein
MSSHKPERPDIRIAKPPDRVDATLAIKIQVPDPSVDRLPVLKPASERVREKMGAKIAGWHVVGSGDGGIMSKEVPPGSGKSELVAGGTGLVLQQDGAGHPRYKTLPLTLQSFGQFEIDFHALGDEGRLKAVRFLVLHTRTKPVFFLVYDVPMESLYENRHIMSSGVDLKKRDILLDESGKRLYLSRVWYYELNKLNELAALSAKKKESLGSGEAFGLDELKAKLSRSASVHVVGEGFSMQAFVDGVIFNFPQVDDHNDYRYIVSGEEQSYYRLYVNQQMAGDPPGCTPVASFRNNGDHCLLYKEV